ncbi:monocarboxylate transporter [Histoplasma ohiense]|nr:monocarboxylate transporter [Histoplasma ohiense (nom. inval.)]
MVSRLIKSHGFATSIRWSMVVVGITMLIGILLCDTPFPPQYKLKKLQIDEEAVQHTDRKSSQDIEPDDSESVRNKAEEVVLDSPVLETATSPINEEKSAKGMGVLLQRKPLGWAGFVLGTFFFMWSFLAPFNYLPLMSVATGISPDLAQYTLTVTNAGSMFGRVGLGAVSDKLGAFNVMCIVTTFTATSVLAFWLPLSNSPSTVGIFMFGGIYGVASGGFISLIAPCVVSLADSQLENLGITFGLVCIGLAFGALVGLPAMAAVKDSATSHSFEELIVFTGAVLAVGSVCMIFARYMKGGINIWTKV